MSQSNVCMFCQASFTRPDALKRHWNTCSARRDASIEIPKISPKSRGRRPKACDQCSSLKRACVSLGPQQSCELCTTKRISCSYRRFARKISDRRDRLGHRDVNSPMQNTNLDLSSSLIDGRSPALTSLASAIRSPEDANSFRDDTSWCSDFNWLNHNFTRTFQVEYSMASPYNCRPTNVQLFLATSLPFFFRVSQSIGLASTFECGTPADRSRVCHYALELSVHKSATRAAYIEPRANSRETIIDRQRTPASFLELQCQPLSTASPDPSGHDLLSHQIESPKNLNDFEALVDQTAEFYNLGNEFSFNFPTENVISGVSGLDPELTPFQTEDTGSRPPSRCQQVIDRLREATLHRQQNSIISITWSPSLEKVCLQLFTSENQERFLALFWSAWYPNWPTIHQPSFDPMEAHLDLVTTMMLMGACMSPRQTDRSMASIWFNTIEELIFSANDFSSYQDDQSQPVSPIDWLSDRLGLLQAAYCICLLQTWEGSRESKRRIRRHRYNSLIWLARDIGFQYGNLKSVSTEDLASFDWKAFIVKESFIRIITYIYNLDSAYAMFCSQPPRLLYHELQIDLTAPELCFQADSPEECFVLLKAWRDTFCHVDLSLFKTVQMICSDRTIYSDTLFSHMSVLNMFTIIHVLYAITFQVEKLFMATIDTAWLQKGLANWRDLWASPSRDEEIALGAAEAGVKSIRRTGFTQHAPEIWFLAHSSLNQTVENKGVSAAAENDRSEPEGSGMAHLKSMVDRFRIGV